ncbi:hypothetical protein [Cryobacterium tagatosivorans]|uniref:hypothetical protein n=1 Tax=Cryobacterium tagatosivorans TaxID=1259199 RepID=UPI00141ACBD9|nr:hypothetical protein [Cryobacterium tagatosivorans]
MPLIRLNVPLVLKRPGFHVLSGLFARRAGPFIIKDAVTVPALTDVARWTA